MTITLNEKELETIHKAKQIANDIRDRVKETENLRRIPNSTIQQLKDHGIFKMCVQPGMVG